jgi:hypothetical protein
MRFGSIEAVNLSVEPNVHRQHPADSSSVNIASAEIVAYSKLRVLVMDWGLRPCWIEDAIDEGVNFIRQFPSLEVLTLVVKFSDHGWPEGETRRSIGKAKRLEDKRIASSVRAAFARGQRRFPGWKPPQLRVVPRKQ